MDDWQYTGLWVFVVVVGVVLVVVFPLPFIDVHPDGSVYTVYGVISAFVLNQGRYRKNDKRDKKAGDDDAVE